MPSDPALLKPKSSRQTRTNPLTGAGTPDTMSQGAMTGHNNIQEDLVDEAAELLRKQREKLAKTEEEKRVRKAAHQAKIAKEAQALKNIEENARAKQSAANPARPLRLVHSKLGLIPSSSH